ncbi:MAG TPA: response regulator [Puia sp.]|nr:response regulator [Puia sp.]
MKKILVIEDERDVRENIAEILLLSGYEVSKADDGLSGVEMALADIPDLIICDITMPRLDGYQVLHSLHRHSRTSNIPFIFLTASLEKEQVRRAMTAGADDYLTKPFEGIELLNAVESCLKKRRLRQAAAAQKTSRPPAAAQGQTQVPVTELLRLLPDQRDIDVFHKKQMIFQEGQRPTALFYLLTGKIKTFRIHPDGKEFITNIAGPGEFIGYSPLLQDINYQDNAQVLEDGSMMLIPRQEFLQLMAADSRVTQHFIDLLARDVKAQEHSLVNLAYNSLRKRVANGLLQLVAKFPTGDGEGAIGISRDNLSHFIGSATESLTRTLSDFRNERLIDIRDGKIYLLNRERLSNLAN